MDQIAVLNIRNGEVKPHGDRPLTEQDLTEIRTWMARRSEQLARREVDDLLRTVDGDGSGVDTDRLDGLDSTQFMRTDRNTGTQGDLTVDEDDLTVPHPRMTERNFVMVPLLDLAPDLAMDAYDPDTAYGDVRNIGPL